jgi:hypothetical protein
MPERLDTITILLNRGEVTLTWAGRQVVSVA